MKRVAIPRLGESVAPCFEYSASVAIFTIKNGAVVEQIDSVADRRCQARIPVPVSGEVVLESDVLHAHEPRLEGPGRLVGLHGFFSRGDVRPR